MQEMKEKKKRGVGLNLVPQKIEADEFKVRQPKVEQPQVKRAKRPDKLEAIVPKKMEQVQVEKPKVEVVEVQAKEEGQVAVKSETKRASLQEVYKVLKEYILTVRDNIALIPDALRLTIAELSAFARYCEMVLLRAREPPRQRTIADLMRELERT